MPCLPKGEVKTMFTYEHYQESAAAIREKLAGLQPRVLLILGSGLGFLGDAVESAVAIDYRDIPHFRVSTAPESRGTSRRNRKNLRLWFSWENWGREARVPRRMI